MANRIFKGKGEITKEIEAVIVGSISQQRERNSLGYVIVKLPEGDKSNHECLKGWVELSDLEIKEELQKVEWTTPFQAGVQDYLKNFHVNKETDKIENL